MSGPAGCIWIQGAGELASGVALRLVRSGYRVVAAEIDNPLAVRRLVSFSEAVYEGRVDVEGVPGVLVAPDEACFLAGTVNVLVDPYASRLPGLAPQAVIDARMTKRTPEPLPHGGIPVIGLGPGFIAGDTAALVVETHRGARLGEVIDRGCAAVNTGVPGVVGGESARRVVYSPTDGRLAPAVEIGDLVEEGQVLGHVAGQEVTARLSGLVRGLVHPRAELSRGVKVGDIDPRGRAVDAALVTDKALGIAGGVLEALLRLGVLPAVRK